MTVQTRRKGDVPAARRESGWLWPAQVALALVLFSLLTALWAYLWMSWAF